MHRFGLTRPLVPPMTVISPKNEFKIVQDNQKKSTLICRGCNRCCHGYAGAGILLLSTDGKFVYMTREKNKNGVCNDFGGSIHCNKSLIRTAINELEEETRGCVKLSERQVANSPSITLDLKYHLYKLYAVRLNYVPIDNCNFISQINGDTMPEQWNESDGMVKFETRLLKRNFFENNSMPLNKQYVDVNGKSYFLDERVRKSLYKLFINNII